MNELALFAGAGGGILGGHLLGWRTVAAVEIEDYPRRVLLQRQADGFLPRFPIWDDICTFDGKPWRGKVDVISGGFPCQDISIAGGGGGLDGARSGLWSEMARVIGEVQPTYAFVENSPMLTVRGLGTVLGDLSEMGYDCRWGVISAADIGANHKRERIWIVANSKHSRYTNTVKGKHGKEVCLQGEDRQTRSGSGVLERTSDLVREWQSCGLHEKGDISHSKCLGWEERSDEQGVDGIRKTSSDFSDSCETFSNTSSKDVERQRKVTIGIESKLTDIGNASWWEFEPELGRVADGVADRVHRLKALGNGQVPLCAATAWRILNKE